MVSSEMEVSRGSEAGCGNEAEDGALSGDAYVVSAVVSYCAKKNEDGGLLLWKKAKRDHHGVRVEMSKRQHESGGRKSGDRLLHVCQNESHEMSYDGSEEEPSSMDLTKLLEVK